MHMLILAAVLLLLGQSTLAQYDPVDESLGTHPNEDFIKTSMLPGGPPTTAKDDLQMTIYCSRDLPELSSGVIATTVYNESILMSGLYRSTISGGQTFATRVRIPNYAMFRINRTDDDAKATLKRTFYFNITKAVWEETIETPNYYIRSIMAVHAHYSRTFFHAIRVSKKQASSAQSVRTFTLSAHHAKLLTDSKFTEDLQLANALAERLSEAEGADGFIRTANVQGATDSSDNDIVIISNGPQISNTLDPVVNMQFTFRKDQTVSENLYIQTVAPAKDKQSALEEYKKVQSSLVDINGLLNLHTQAWEKRFKAGNIEVQGSGENYAKMNRLIRSSLYQIYSQFPFADRFAAPAASGPQYDDLAFNGVSACGLGRAGNSSRTARVDFAGHVTPDQELFLFAPLAILQPDLARQILFYRARQLQTNNPPVPFEAARSGSSVEPVWCSHCQQQALYATGLLGLAVRHYHAVTRDQAWVDQAQRGGIALLEKIGRYFDQKIQKNTTRSGDYYSITGVSGPDELHQSQTNNLLTNALAALSIHYWSYLNCISGKPKDTTQEALLDRARRLAFPFNSAKPGHNEQFEGYDYVATKSGRVISQADVWLAHFPAGFNMSGYFLEQSRLDRLNNDIQKYPDFESTADRRTGAPATSIAIKTILHLQGGTNEHIGLGKVSFDELWKMYASSPFFIWRNITDHNDVAATGHIGTAAAFIETLIFGFGGLRLQANRLDLLRPSLPIAELTAIHFKGLHFFGGEFDYSVTSDNKIRLNPLGGSAFKTGMVLYDRTNKRYDQFSGTVERDIPAQPTNLKSTDVPSTAALYSLVSVDTSKTSCRLDDTNVRSHNPYFTTAGAVTLLSTPVMLAVSLIIALASNRLL